MNDYESMAISRNPFPLSRLSIGSNPPTPAGCWGSALEKACPEECSRDRQRQIETDRDRETERDRERERQRDRQTDRQTDR